jgi:hypothetical protein
MTSPVSIELDAVWGSGPKDVYASGETGVIIHYDGSSWKQERAGGQSCILRLHGTGPDDVWGAGCNYVVHRTGGKWTSESPCADPDGILQDFECVWAISPGEVLASFDDDGAPVCHLKNGVWQREDTNTGNGAGLRTIWGQDPISIWGAGPPIVFNNGVSWSLAVSGVFYEAIWGSATDDIWAIADTAPPMHYDGGSWTLTTDPVRSARIWGANGNDIYAVSGYSIWHYDGKQWSKLTNPGQVALRDVWVSTTGEVFAVGINGGILHWSP